MKQVLQHLDSGLVELADVPVPRVGRGQVLIRTTASVISIGTEKMLMDFGRASLLGKVRKQPERVREVLDKIRTDGVAPTLRAVRAKLGIPLPLGYSNAGIVVEVGADVRDVSVGDRVVSNGPHAHFVRVPVNLCAKIPALPTAPSDEVAAFTVVAAIGLQGIRLAAPTLGETFAVTGLGLIGLLTAQLLQIQGCHVIGIDLDPAKVALARAMGIHAIDVASGEDPVETALTLTQGRGVDGVILTASTPSNDPIRQAAQMCRKRGRIVLVGVTGLDLARNDFYQKELTFQVSCSYGPGRYDTAYEEKGQDYPLGFVRWTEKRNFEAILDLMASGRLDPTPFITHRIAFAEASQAYDALAKDRKVLGVVLQYPASTSPILPAEHTVALPPPQRPAIPSNLPRIGLLGAGNFTKQVLAPAIAAAGGELKTIVSSGGVSSVQVGKQFGFAQASTDAEVIFQDESIDTVIITTRPDTHASYVLRSLRAGKHVFVEKPLALTLAELAELETVYKGLAVAPVLGIGFNRRFSPHAQTARKLLSTVREPKTLVAVVNAGVLPLDHWTHDPVASGGRIVGEACHFVDLLRFLVGAPIVDVQARMVGGELPYALREDKMTLTLSFQDGSIGTVHYFANGHRAYPKERIEVFCGGKVLAIDNFKSMTGYGWSGFSRQRLWTQDKGHRAEMVAFLTAVRNRVAFPISFDEMAEVTRATFEAVEVAGKALSARL